MMKIYKPFFLIIAFLISMTVFGEKGQKLTSEQRAANRVQKVNQVCNLSPQQQEQLTQVYLIAINERIQQRENKALKSAQKGTDPLITKKTMMAAKREQLKTSVQNILTEEQQAQWQAYRQQQKKK